MGWNVKIEEREFHGEGEGKWVIYAPLPVNNS